MPLQDQDERGSLARLSAGVDSYPKLHTACVLAEEIMVGQAVRRVRPPAVTGQPDSQHFADDASELEKEDF
jgi:hypothetical protein